MENNEPVYKVAQLLNDIELDKPTIEKAVAMIIKAVGEDPDREGMKRTPERVARAFEELLVGYRTDPVELLNDAVFDVSYDEMVLVRDIEFYSLCEHHMLPFFGKCHVAYIPDGKIVGLSKIPRIVDAFGRRLQVQERLTSQIADSLSSILKPKGVAVVIDALHLCMSMRGVEKQNSYTTTSSMLGAFKSNPSTRSEFLSLLAGRHR